MHDDSQGFVIELQGENAIVMPTKKLGCTEVHCCQGSGVKRVNVLMLNTVGAKIGDRVEFSAKESNMLKAAFVVYVMPLLFIVAGALAGYNMVAPGLGWEPAAVATLLGVVSFILSIFIIKAYDNYASTSPKLKPHIISVIEDAADVSDEEKAQINPYAAG